MRDEQLAVIMESIGQAVPHLIKAMGAYEEYLQEKIAFDERYEAALKKAIEADERDLAELAREAHN